MWLFGFLESLLVVWLWWPIAIGFFIFEGLLFSRSAKDSRVGAFAGHTILMLVGLHLLGIFDVVSFI